MKLEKNVAESLSKISEVVGNYHNEMFNITMSQDLSDQKITSPIEQILYAAMNCVKEVCQIDDFDSHRQDGVERFVGLNICPQYTIDRYRVDFLVCHFKNQTYEESKNSGILVECDSQKFHDRNEHERSYEKERDRFLQKQGYKVFRFTGAEIIKNPIKCAIEIISFSTGRSIEYLTAEMSNLGVEI
jgi:very-short-patch-repair endonuclease